MTLAQADEMDQPTLVWQKADGSTVDIPIPPDEPVTLGRDASNMVVLQSTFVSKRHATVGIEGGQFVVRDLKSANGTRVNGETATLTPLAPGDVVVTAGLTAQLDTDLPRAAIPKGVPIGTIEQAQADGHGQTAELRPFVDPDRIRFAWVILDPDG